MSLLAATLLASSVASSASPAPVSGPPPRPQLNATRVAQPPSIDGRLDDEVWQRAPATTAFTQKFPDEGRAPSEPTSVRVLYDDDAVYVGFDCTQLDSPIVAPLTRRDRQIEADTVTFTLDTRGDGRSAFEFWVSAAGVVGDTLRSDDTDSSTDWDEVWQAKVARTERGWSAEYRIPLRALRFRGGGVQTVRSFGMQARRWISRKQETDEWAFIPRDAAGEVSHYGRLEGLTGVRPRSSIEGRISIVGGIQHRDPSVDVLGAGFTPLYGLGLDLKWHATPDLTLDAAIRPDFAQVEADQVILNLTTFELFFPEKRPFFLEGNEVFTTPMPLLYTRRIGHVPKSPSLRGGEQLIDLPTPMTIVGASKLTGQLAPGWTIGTLTALASARRVAVQQADGSTGDRMIDPLTSYSILRLKRAVGDHGYIGGMVSSVARAERYSDLAVIDPSDAPGASSGALGRRRALCPSGATVAYGNTCAHDALVGSLDARWRSDGGDYQALAQLVGTRIQGGVARTLADGTPVASGDMGVGGRAMLAKEGGKHWLWRASYDFLSRRADFNDLGYMQRQAMHAGVAQVTYRTLEPAGPTLETESKITATMGRNLDGLFLDRTLAADVWLRLRSFIEVWNRVYVTATRFDDREVGDGTALERVARMGQELWIGGDSRKPVRPRVWMNTELFRGGFRYEAQGGLRVQALPQLEIDLMPSFLYTHGERRAAGALSSALGGDLAGAPVFGTQTAASVGATLRATYTFTPSITLQTYAQLFVAKTHYEQFAVAGGDPRHVLVDDLRLLPRSMRPSSNPDGEEGTLNVNVVFRWEYSPGSTLFVVYTRAQIPNVTLGDGELPSLSLSAVRRAPATDALLIKLAHWLD